MSSPKCKFKENPHIIFNIQDPECHRCGWNPAVAEERKKELRLRLTPPPKPKPVVPKRKNQAVLWKER